MLSPEDPQTTMKPVTAKRAPERLTPYEAAVKVGLVGCIEGPADLALNHRKYARRAVGAKYRRAKRAPWYGGISRDRPRPIHSYSRRESKTGSFAPKETASAPLCATPPSAPP